MNTDDDINVFIGDPAKEITLKDLLELPELLQIGDWVKFTNYDVTTIFKIVGGLCPYDIDYCNKLTKEQIQILGLE